jgi:carbon monoxide dehydrogenase subunit G
MVKVIYSHQLQDLESAAMEMTGEQCIPATQDAVWAALNDPTVLKACLPGCESIELQSENEYRVTMLAAVGPVKARFNGKLAIRDSNPPRGYALSFEGSGGAAGFGRGQASVALAPVDGGTQLAYTASAEVSGKLAQVGSRLIDGVAKRMAAEFFARFKATFTAPAEAGQPLSAARAAADADHRATGHRGTAAAVPQPAVDEGTATAAAKHGAPAYGAQVPQGRDIYRELRVWQTLAVAAIAAACLAIGYIIGAY